MINLRYHIVSITAVFLALGIGVALGGTFFDRYTVDLLQRNIRNAEAGIQSTNSENDRLGKLVAEAQSRDRSLVETGAPQLLSDLLTDVPVLVISAPGVDAKVLADLRRALASAGADLRGTLELRDELLLTDQIDKDVATASGQDPADPEAVKRAVFAQLRSALRSAAQPATPVPVVASSTTTTAPPLVPTTAGPGTTAAGMPTSTTSPGSGTDGSPAGPDGQPEIVTALLATDYARLVPGPGLRAGDPILDVPGYRYVLVSGPDLAPSANDLLRQLLSARRAADVIPAVVVSATVPDDQRTDRDPTLVADVRASKDLAARYSTVDDVDHFAGLVATVLTLGNPDRAAPGHYGQAEGATSVLPPPS